jgi:RNA polymerase sigma-70 factor (ECF subfamily)
MGYREIAEIMDCPVDTVKTRMFHARRHLKRRLAGELPDWI